MVKYKNPRHEEQNLETEALEKLEQEYKEPAKTVEDEVWKKRAADKDRYITQIKAEAKARADELERKLDQALRGQLKAPKSKEEVEQWKKEYPEFAGILETLVEDRIREATSNANEKLEQLSRRERELDQEKAVSTLRKLHSDFDKLAKSEDFHTWLGGRPEADKEAIYRGLDVNKADLVITKYKAEKGTLKSKVDDEGTDPREAAKVVRQSRSSEPVEDFGDYDFSESQIERESKKNRRWFEQNEEKIIEAARKGKLLYDISGGAR